MVYNKFINLLLSLGVDIMVITTTANNLQNYFERYLKNFQEKNKVSRLISKDTSTSFLTDSLTGILKNDYSEKDIIAEKYEGSR